jgi:uncharacterized membrane protein SirB2
MATVFISITFFITRALWVFRQSVADIIRLNKKWVRILPHVNDTILLVSAIFLAVSIEQYPFVHTWLTAKLIALIFYIVFGMFALKRAKTKNTKIVFFALAIVTFFYIAMVALTRSATWFY